MATYRTIVARTGFVDLMIEDLAGNSTFVSADGQWRGLVAEDEAAAIEVANEKFIDDSRYIEYTLAEDSTDAWEITFDDGDTVIGWSMTADGWPTFDEE